MKKEVVIDKYGLGHAVAVLEKNKIIDCFIDPPSDARFYPPNTFVRAKIDRKAPNMGGYFVKLPNGMQGFLRSKNKYVEGSSIFLLSQVFFEEYKSQTFTDKLKTVTKYFVLKISTSGYSFSKKLPVDFDKSITSKRLQSKLKNFDDIFVICRSSSAKITVPDFDNEVEKAISHIQTIKSTLARDSIYFDGLDRKVALEKYRTKSYNIKEEEGVFEQLGIWDKLEEIKNGRVHLDTGSYLIFEQTSAFVTIDVNSGIDLKATKEEINLSACNEIFRIIRVCGFGGKILIDFLPCSYDLRNKIYKKISDCFSKDTVKYKIWGWTKSGIFELECERDKIPLKLLM